MRRYTVSGSPALEQKIASDMEIVANRVCSILPVNELASLILGGGYGRGEGGVKTIDGREMLFNDYDIFVIMRHIPLKKQKQWQQQLCELGTSLSAEFGIEVDFSPMQRLANLPHAPYWLIWYELKYGHQVIWGKQNVLRYLPGYKHSEMPLIEAAKLLLNRGVGLSLAKENIDKLSGKPVDDFIARNIYKAIQAMGDALLICYHRYHWSYLERSKRFQALTTNPLIEKLDLKQAYAEAINYKLTPYEVHYDKAGFTDWYSQIMPAFREIYYYVFSQMLGRHILDVRSYQAHLGERLELQPDVHSTLRNLYLNMRDYRGKAFQLDTYVRYPRYRLFYCLPWYLFHEKTASYQLDVMLGLPEQSSDDTRRQAFLNLWKQYN